MTTLSIHRFDGPQTAERKVRLLEPRPGLRVTADDAAVLAWPETADRPTAWQASPISARNPLTGAFWGLLFAHLFLIPLSYAQPPTITLDHPDDALAPLGLTAEHLATVRSLLVPGSSAVLALHSDESLAEICAALGPPGQQDVTIVLDPVQTRRLLAGFAENIR